MPTVHHVKRPWAKAKPQAEVNASRGGNAETQFYRQSKWANIRAYVLREQPLCVMCLSANPKRITAATMVDHIVPVKQGGDKYELSNLQPLDAACHAKKSSDDRKKYKQL